MDLTHLGYDSWFAEHAASLAQPDRLIARVTAVDRDAFLVRMQERDIYAEIAGRLRYTAESVMDLPGVGDWVSIHWPSTDGPAIIHDVLPRRTFLRRKSAGKTVDFQMMAANLDVAFIVQGCQSDFNVRRLDRYLVVANDGRIEPRIILTKTDLVTPAEQEVLVAAIRGAGITAPVLLVSNETGEGLEAFRASLEPGRTYCLLGSSGVGKTTLINRLLGREAFETRDVSGTGEGVHTTSRRQLLVLDSGAMLIDTPGMREIGLVGTAEGMDATFADIAEFAEQCRFPDCTHAQEPGCAVQAALAGGTLSEERFQSYLKLRKESEYHNMTYLEKRRKDRAFGKLVKSVKKQIKDRDT